MENKTAGVWKKFYFPKDEVHKHRFYAIENLEFASSEFYQMIEKELQARKLPGWVMSRIKLSEGRSCCQAWAVDANGSLQITIPDKETCRGFFMEILQNHPIGI